MHYGSVVFFPQKSGYGEKPSYTLFGEITMNNWVGGGREAPSYHTTGCAYRIRQFLLPFQRRISVAQIYKS